MRVCFATWGFGNDCALDACLSTAHRLLLMHPLPPCAFHVMCLCGRQEVIEAEVKRVLAAAGPRGHILNVGHGVVQGTPEENVGLFCELARQSGQFHQQQQQQNGAAAQQLVGSAV
jgi:hypothetical protein